MALSLSATISDFTKQAIFAWGVRWNQATMTLADKLAPATTVIPSNFETETLITMSATPPAVEYSEGDVPVGEIESTSPYVLRNKLFGRAIKIGRSNFADMDNNPASKAMFLQKVAGLATVMKNVKSKALKDLIRGVGLYDSANTAKDVNAFDGVDFFSTSGRAMGSNLIDGATTFDHSTLRSEYDTIINTFMSHKALGIESLESGTSSTYLRDMPPDRFIILCNPSQKRVIEEAWLAQMIGALFSSASASAGGVSSINNVIAAQNVLTVIPVQDIPASSTGAGYYVFDVSDSLPGETPLVFLDREAPGIELLGPGSDTYTLAEIYYYKARGRFTWGWGHPAKAIFVDKSS